MIFTIIGLVLTSLVCLYLVFTAAVSIYASLAFSGKVTKDVWTIVAICAILAFSGFYYITHESPISVTFRIEN